MTSYSTPTSPLIAQLSLFSYRFSPLSELPATSPLTQPFTVNSIAWAPYELGPILACASSDGKISVINFQNDGATDASVFPAHGTGANAISWAPSSASASASASAGSGAAGAGGSGAGTIQKRFVSAGSDNLIKIWLYDDESKKWIEEETIKEHEDWVRDVAWAPNIGLPGMYVASASQVSLVLFSFNPVYISVGFLESGTEGRAFEAVLCDSILGRT